MYGTILNMFSTFLMIIILILILVRKLLYRQFWIKMDKFDGPRRLLFFGNALELRGSPTECFKTMHKWIKEYSGCFVFTLFSESYVVTNRREDVPIFSKMLYKIRSFEFFKYSIGAGLVVSNGEKWKKSRDIVESAFTTSELFTNILHIFNQHSYLLINEIKVIGLGEEFNVWPLVLRVFTKTISETIIGTSNTDDLNISQGYGTGNKKCEALIMKRMYSPWLHPEFMFKLYLKFIGQSHAFDNIRRPFLQAIRNQKKLALKKRTISGELSQPSRKLLLNILMESNDLSDEELNDEIMTLMFAGSDTSATVTCFTLLMLAMHPEIQEKVYEELNTVFNGSDRAAEKSDLQKLTLLEQCIKETMRKFPIPIILRQAVTDVTLSDGRVIPAGANIILSIHDIHHNPDFYPKPESWNPYNFNPDKVSTRPINTYIPFGSGQRLCVGYKYAMMSLKVFLSHVLRNFKLTTQQSEMKLHFNVLVKCASGYHLKFEPR